MTALVTGGSRGIGRAICVELAKQGISVIINYGRNKEEAEITLAECNNYSSNNCIYTCDVSNENSVKAMFEFIVSNYGGIDILVNNAGINKDKLLIAMSEQDFASVIDTNLKGVFLVTKEAINLMKKKRSGKIVNLSSVSGVVGNAGQANYAASKAGVIAFTKTIAKEYASRNILANAVAPGFIATDMTKAMNQKAYEQAIESIPLKRAGTAEEVAKLVAFLVGDGNTYISGQTINIDGGLTTIFGA